MKRYKTGDRIPVRAQQIWMILTAHAVLKPDNSNGSGDGWSGWGPGLITYGDLAEQMGMNRKAAVSLGKHLGVIGFYCKEEGLPPLNSIVIAAKEGEPGHGVVETDGFTKDQKKVWKTDWFEIRPPTIKRLRDIYDEYIAIPR